MRKHLDTEREPDGYPRHGQGRDQNRLARWERELLTGDDDVEGYGVHRDWSIADIIIIIIM